MNEKDTFVVTSNALQTLIESSHYIKNKDLSDFVIMKKNLDWDQLEAFELISNNFPFLIINKERARSYKNNFIFFSFGPFS